MSEKYDTNKLRSHLMNLFGSAMTAGFDMAIQELTAVRYANDEELLRIAEKNNINTSNFRIKNDDFER